MSRSTFALAAAAAAAALLLSGCATLPGTAEQGGGERQVSTGQCVVAAGVAALACAVSANRDQAIRAALCGAAAFTICEIAASFTSARTQTAEQVREQHLRTNRQLPPRAMVTEFTHAIDPQRVQAGQQVRLTSAVVVVPGRANAPVSISERVEVRDSAGNRWGEPFERVHSASDAGGFSSEMSFGISNRFQQGQYSIHRTLLLNGEPVRQADSRFQVVQTDDGLRFALLDQ